VKVRTGTFRKSALRSRALLTISLSMALLFSVLSSSAGAITRPEVLKRASTWVKRRVPYSQRSYFQGYRRDCSGFVSMAWRLKDSYSSHTISSVARRVSITSLKPGDAVLKPGHVSLFGGWENKARREYIAIEETTWGSHAKRHVRQIPHHAVGLRRRGIIDRRRVLVASRRARKPSARPGWTPVLTSISCGPLASDVATPTMFAAAASAISAPVTTDPLQPLGRTVGLVGPLLEVRLAGPQP
jgi:hypothetical protein